MPIVTLEIKPFEVPQVANVYQSGSTGVLPVALAAVGDQDFHNLVSAWVDAIYKKANKQQPPQPARPY